MRSETNDSNGSACNLRDGHRARQRHLQALWFARSFGTGQRSLPVANERLARQAGQSVAGSDASNGKVQGTDLT